MIPRPHYLKTILYKLKSNPIVSILGPRQVGKTTLAQVVAQKKSHYFDLEDPIAINRLTHPKSALEPLKGLIVIDEIQRKPELFPLLRIFADRHPLPARFLILGSASPALIREVSESLAGRISFVDLHGFDLSEVGPSEYRKLWWRGGYPRSYLAASDSLSYQWRMDLIRTFLERDIPQLGITIPASTLRRFWSMTAHFHGQIWNAADFARSLGTAEATARRYLDILSSTFMIRQLPPWFENLGKRQIKAFKIYIRDTGLLHSLLSLDSFAMLEGHPKLGASWEGFAMEQVLRLTGDNDAWFWATHSGAELDLMVQWKGKRIGFEFKYGDAARLTKSMHIALHDLKLKKLFVVYPGKESYPLHDKIEAVSILHLQDKLDK